MTRNIDPSLAALLERCEMAAWGEFYGAASPNSVAACGLRLEQRDGALAVLAAAADVLGLNRVVGLGLERAAAGKTLDHLIGLYTQARVPRFFLQVCPTVLNPDVKRLLEDRGFRHYNNWMKLYRDTSPPPAAQTDLAIEQISAEHALDFGRIVADCFDWPEPARAWVADAVGRPGWSHYMAFDDSTPVATGALYQMGKQAWIDFATTLPEYRGHGAQSALLARRIGDAANLGCQLLVVETAEETAEKPAPSYRNNLRFGFRAAYARPNYIYYTES